MTYQTIETQLSQGIALIWLNRPEARNALSPTMLDELTDAIGAAAEDDEVRAIVLAGRGKAFCAGADLNWMKSARDLPPAQAREDSMRLARLLRLLHDCPKPTIARVHGAAYAGAMGLVAACDIAVASHRASFCLSDARLGLLPAMISPYVIKAMGENAARRYFLTGEVLGASEAYRIGFVHELAAHDELDGTVNALLGHLVQGSPEALAAGKRLIRDVAGRPIDDALAEETAARTATNRASADAQEGIAAFFEQRRPRWAPEPPPPDGDDDDE